MFINSQISSLENSRIIFSGGLVNPTRRIGMSGIAIHSYLTSFFYSSIAVQSVFSKDSERKETFYLDKRSTIEWINAQSTEKLTTKDTNLAIVKKINHIVANKIDWTQFPDYHKGQPSTRRLLPIFDRIESLFYRLYWHICLSSWSLFRLRFKLVTNENLRLCASQTNANYIFHKARKEVPAYKKFLEQQNANPKTFDQIPLTDKDNYIKKFSIPETMVGGKLPKSGQVDTSTGTSGKPTMWVRGAEERYAVKTLLNFAATVVVRNKPLFFINAFALGPWATGITTAGAMVDRAITFNAGPDADKILDFLENFPPEQHPERIYVIAGYPPFMKLLVEKATERNIDLKKYPLKAVVGGEACSDLLRSSILRSEGKPQGFEEVYSSYGASDLDINIGYESPFELQLREACRLNPEMAAELYGYNEPVPMIFHYDPLNYKIETNENQNLIFTCVRDYDRSSPRIRYNLKDRGKILPMSEVQAILKKYGVNIITPNTNLPILFIWGREGTVNYRGAKVPHEHLQEAIEKVGGFKGVINNYAFNTFIGADNNPVVEIWLEFKKGQAVPFGSYKDQLKEELINQLKDINQDFRFQIDNAPQKDWPQLKLFEHGKAGFMSNQDPHRKKKYVLDNGK